MKLFVNGQEYRPQENKVNKEDIVVDVHYDRQQKLYAICLRDRNTRYVLSDYEYAKDKKEAQFVKAMMQKDLRNYLDKDYELVEALQQDEKVKDKNGRDFNIWTESTGDYEGNYMKIAYVGDNWIDDNDKIIRDNILGYLEYSVLDDNEDKAYVQMIEVKKSEQRKGVATALINSLQKDYKEIDYGYTTGDGTQLLKSLGIRESVDDELTFKFPNLQKAIDYYWSDRDVKVERIPIEQLVKDNDLLNDWSLESYHKTLWGNKPASEFSIDTNKVNSMRTTEVPYAVRKKDGTLELGDGRHRTRALYNDGYKYVELPVINETLDYPSEKLPTNDFSKEDDKLTIPQEKSENKGNLGEKLLGTDKVGSEVQYFESPYGVKDYLLNANDTKRIFIDTHIPLYLVCSVWESTHIKMIEVARANGFDTSLSDFDPKKICIVFVPKNREYDFTVDDAELDDYDYMYQYDEGFTVYSRYEDFRNFELYELLGNCTSTKLGESLTEATIQMSSKLKGLADECIKTLNDNGLTLPDNLVVESSDRVRALGDAAYPREFKHRVRISKYLEDMSDEQIKNTIYHELGHVLAHVEDFDKGLVKLDKDGNTVLVGPTRADMLRHKKRLSHHGPRWQAIMQKISKITGQSYQRLADAESTSSYQDAIQDDGRYKYFFVCPKCGCKLKYTKATQFVKDYDKETPEGEPCWYCAICKKNTGEKVKFVKVDN